MTSKDKLFALINTANPLPRPLTPNNVEIVNPRLAVGSGYNTRATVRAITDRGYSREQDVFYRRIDLAALAPVQYRIEEVGTPSQLLAMLNARRGTWLELEDVLAFTMPNVSQGSQAPVTLTAADESYGFIGTVQVMLTRDAVIPAASVTAGEASVDPEDATKRLYPFTVSLSGATSSTVSVGIRTVDGTAIGDVDYDAILELVQFLPGETTKLVTVRANRNTTEADTTFSVLLSDPTHCTIAVGTAGATIPSEPASDLPAVSVGDATFELIPPPVAMEITLQNVMLNSLDPAGRYAVVGADTIYENRPGVELTFHLSRDLLPGETLSMQRRFHYENGWDDFDYAPDISPGGDGVLRDETYDTNGPSYDRESDGYLEYRLVVTQSANGQTTHSDLLSLSVQAEGPSNVTIFQDTFSGEGTLNAHQPDVNLLADYNWPPGNGSFPYSWSSSGTAPVAMRTGGKLVMGSPNDAALTLEPGTNAQTSDPNPPISQAYMNSYTASFVWRSPRTSAQDAALTDSGYPLQLSVGKSDVTFEESGSRMTIGFTINANDGTSKTLAFYGEEPVDVSYEADTDYVGVLVVEPGKRTLYFLGQELTQYLEAETKHHLIVGPFYLHMGANCQLDDLKLVTGRQYYVAPPAPVTWTETFDVPQDQTLVGHNTDGFLWEFYPPNGQGSHVGDVGGLIKPGPAANLYASDVVWLPYFTQRTKMRIDGFARVAPGASAEVSFELLQRNYDDSGNEDTLLTVYRQQNTDWQAIASTAISQTPTFGGNPLTTMRFQLELVHGQATAHIKFFNDAGDLIGEGDFNLNPVVKYDMDRIIGLAIRTGAFGTNRWDSVGVFLRN